VPSGASAKAINFGMINTTGYPGTKGVSASRPGVVDGPLVHSAQGSYNAPDYIYPNLYYGHVNNLRPGNGTIRVKSTNEMPVPATRINRIPGIAARTAHMPSIRQLTWPPAPQAWQSSASQGGS
jgi:hypothetical protein